MGVVPASGVLISQQTTHEPEQRRQMASVQKVHYPIWATDTSDLEALVVQSCLHPVPHSRVTHTRITSVGKAISLIESFQGLEVTIIYDALKKMEMLF